MAGPGTVIGWKLPEDVRAALLERFPPRYARTDADHVTLSVGTAATTPLPPDPVAAIVGRGDDGTSLECLVVEIDGTTDRPDGSTYHITWSLGPGREPRESNDLLRERGCQRIPQHIILPPGLPFFKMASLSRTM
jgi:hypothetical protein